MVAILFLGVVALAAGIGMWRGKSWGWWLGAFYLMYSVARNISAIVTLPIIVGQFELPEAELAENYIKYAGRIVIHSLLVLYFFKANVEAYFNVDHINAWRRFFTLLVATVVITGAAMMLSAW